MRSDVAVAAAATTGQSEPTGEQHAETLDRCSAADAGGHRGGHGSTL